MNTDLVTLLKDARSNNLKNFSDQRATLVHTSIHEFVVTRRPQQYGLYPLLNLVELLIQKPLLIVIFTKKLSDTKPKWGPGCGWVHSIPHPLHLKEKFDKEISARLRDIENTKEHWIFERKKFFDSDFGPNASTIYALGILYLDLRYENRSKNPIRKDDQREKDAGKALSVKTSLKDLCDTDKQYLVSLFSSISHYVSPDIKSDRTHLRLISTYCQNALSYKSLFTINNVDKNDLSKDIDLSAKEISEKLKPLIEEIDAIYCELRGGTPGDFSLDTFKDAGAAILWSRHRESVKAGSGIRPLTVAFYMQIRAPSISTREKGKTYVEHGYRIVPVITKSMCKDLAAVLLESLHHKGSDAEIRKYLKQLGVSQKTCDSFKGKLNNPTKLSNAIYGAAKIISFLDENYFHSFTYPAFSSGTSMFTPASPCSKCDYFFYGPEFLEEKEAVDTAFTKPITISGYPFLSFVTKTRGPTDHNANINFHAFYYNYNFQMGVIRRWVSRRIRMAMRRTYLKTVERIFIDTIEFCSKIEKIPGEQPVLEFEITPYPILNAELDQLAQTMPFGLLKVDRSRSSLLEKTELDYVYDTSIQKIELGELVIYCCVLRNSYFGRKLIDNDHTYLKNDDIKAAFLRAYTKLKRTWRYNLNNSGTNNDTKH